MIKNKADYKYYLERDRIALRRTRKRPPLIGEEIWKFEILMRKLEYHQCLSGAHKYLHLPLYLLNRLAFKRLSIKLGFSIPVGTFEEGLSIAHYGCLVVNYKAHIGKNCRIHETVTLGATNGTDDAPKIGNNCFIGTGAKIIGGVTIADDVAIAANAVVTSDILEPGTTWGGIPARKISDNSSRSNLAKGLFQDEKA